MNLTNFLG